MHICDLEKRGYKTIIDTKLYITITIRTNSVLHAKQNCNMNSTKERNDTLVSLVTMNNKNCRRNI